MNANILPSNRAVLMSAIDPDAYTPQTLTSGWVSAADFANLMAVLSWGDLGAATTINAKLEQATDSSGTGAKDISGAAITEVDATDSPIPANKQAIINVRADELDTANSFTHVRLSVTTADSTSPQPATDLAALLFGFDARYAPETDSATVAEVVS